MLGQHFRHSPGDIDFADAALGLRCFQHADCFTELAFRGECKDDVFSIKFPDGLFRYTLVFLVDINVS